MADDLRYQITVSADNDRDASQHARDFADALREINGISQISRTKGQESTMDLGSIVTVIASSGATLAVARGLADWIRGHRQVRLEIKREKGSESIKLAVQSIDPDAASRIAEMVLNS